MAEEAVGRAIAAVGRAMADEAEICPQIIEDLVFPEPSHSLYSSEDRRLIAASIFARGHAANNAGATKDAAVLFREASAVEPEKNTALISYLNMRLKMGDYGVCVAAYLRVLEGRSLNDKEMKHVRQKLHDANRLMALTPAERDAATRITRMARGANARRAFATRQRQQAAAVVVQRWLLRWLRIRGRGHPRLASQVALLRLPPPPPHAGDAGAQSLGGAPAAAAEVLAAEYDARLGADGWLPSLALAPFATLATPWSTPAHTGGALHFVVASRKGNFLYCCALTVDGDDATSDSSTSQGNQAHSTSKATGVEQRHAAEMAVVVNGVMPSSSADATAAAAPSTRAPVDVIVLVSCIYQPHALAAAARALSPLARRVASADDDAKRAFLRAARAFLLQPPPRPTGQPSTVHCAGTPIRLCMPTFPSLPPDEPWRYPHWSAKPPLPSPPPPVEPLYAALHPLREDAIVEALTALLLERKVLLISRTPSRLTSAANALLRLIWPLEWSHALAPIVPPSHEAATGMPFPYLLGKAVGGANEDFGGSDALVLSLDSGAACGWGRLMEPFPELERAKLRRRLQQAIDGEPADVDRGVQLACLGAIASLFSVTAEDEFLTLGHVYKRTGTRTGTLDALDVELSRLTSVFVKRQPAESGAAEFAKGLSETAHFKTLLEHLAMPRTLWPRWLTFFGAWAARANAEHPCRPR